jgi:hypothetical protein
MTVQQLIEGLALTPYHVDDPDRPVTGGYCGDLLSWVMGRAPAGCAWLTIMSHVNVAAVAALADAACVILTEGVAPDPGLLQKAQTQGITLLGSGLSTYSCAARLARLLDCPN